jgi:hypothetical protein
MSAFRNLRLIPALTGASKSNTILQCRMSPARAVKTGKTAWSVGDGKNFTDSWPHSVLKDVTSWRKPRNRSSASLPGSWTLRAIR